MTVEPRDHQTHDVAAKLLDWYDVHARELPWRVTPGSAYRGDPYRTWLSEIMLQQTTVAAVIPYFDRFTARWPDIAALADAADSDVMAAWAGLGYYARARNLLACARLIRDDHDGVVPDSELELRRLPGIGDYTAAAIAAIAFDRPATVIDANVERVVARLFAIRDPLPKAKPAIRASAARLTPEHRPGDFAQAMMDLGSRICTPRGPHCPRCPLVDDCAAYRLGIATELPIKPAKRARPQRQGWAYWIERDGAILLVRRPGRGMLGGMRALPGGEWDAELDQMPGEANPTGIVVQHVFTHFALELHIAILPPKSSTIKGFEGEWWPIESLDGAGLPTLYAKAARAMTRTATVEGS